MSDERFSSVWDAIEDTPENAENMKIRAALMRAIESWIRAEGWSQTEAARRLGVTQPRVSDLVRGKVDLFSIDALVNMIASTGLHVSVDVRAA